MVSYIAFLPTSNSSVYVRKYGGGGNAIQARIGVGYQYFYEKNIMQQLFGSGYGNVPANIYLNGITYVLNTLGIMGLAVFILILARYFKKGTAWKKMGIFTLLILTFFSQTFSPSALVFYLCVFNPFQWRRQ